MPTSGGVPRQKPISFPEPAILGKEREALSGIIRFREESDWPLIWNARFNLSQDSWLPATDYPRASRSFPRIAGSGNEIGKKQSQTCAEGNSRGLMGLNFEWKSYTCQIQARNS